MKAARVRHPVLDGHRSVDAIWFPADWFDEAARGRLLVAAWRPGSAAHRFEGGDLLRFPSPAMLDCGALAGWPLQRLAAGALCSAQVDPAELEDESSADVWLVMGAALTGLRLAEGAPLDVSRWIDAERAACIDTWDLAPPPPERVFVGVEPPRDVREVLGDAVPAASGQARSFLDALRAKRPSKGGGALPPSRPVRPGETEGFGPRGLAWLVAIAMMVGLLNAVRPGLPSTDDLTRRPFETGTPQAPGTPPFDARERERERERELFERITHPEGASAAGAGVPASMPMPPEPTPPGTEPRQADTPTRSTSTSTSTSQPQSQSQSQSQSPPQVQAVAQSPDALPASAPSTSPPSASAPDISSATSASPHGDDTGTDYSLLVVAILFGLFAWAVWAMRRSAASPVAARPVGSGTAAKPGMPGGDNGAAGQAGTAGRAARPGIRERLRERIVPQRWRAWLARLALTTGVSQLLGRQHAAYLRRMLALFEEGDIEEALRHAVPLGDGTASLGQMLGRLGPRQDLRLGAQHGGATSIGGSVALENHLRALYRATFQKLDRAGRIDEAVFVLAELLGEKREALDYLEKHGRLEQAAELALGWDMPAAQIIRLLAIAGDWRRALLVARRDNAFGPAATLLEGRWPDVAARLRREWAQSLATQGRWLAAVDAIWPVVAERETAARWLDIAENAGGTTGARALALRAQCLPDTLVARAERLRALRDDPTLGAERAALALELLALSPPVAPAARRLAATIAGALIADHADPEAPLDGGTLRRVVELAGDPALSADQPGGVFPDRQVRALHARDAMIRWQAPEPGLHAIFDAVPLADREFLVALGESGVLRIDASGRRLARIDTPAHRLVIAHDGRSALALARRERRWRVSRFDLVRARAVDLGHVEAHAFADQYDGLGWTIAEGHRVQVLDTTSHDLRDVLWQVADLAGPVMAIATSPHAESWIVDDGQDGREVWMYALPRRLLHGRDAVRAPDGIDWLLPLAGAGAITLRHDDIRPASSAVRPTPQRHGLWPSCPTPAPGHPLCANAAWIAARNTMEGADGQLRVEPSIGFTLLQTGRVQAVVEWPADVPVAIRAVGAQWLMFDATGRLAWVSMDTGRYGCLAVR